VTATSSAWSRFFSVWFRVPFSPLSTSSPSHFVELPIIFSTIRSNHFSSKALNGTDSKADFTLMNDKTSIAKLLRCLLPVRQESKPLLGIPNKSPYGFCQEISEERRAAYISLRVKRAHCGRASSNESCEVSYVEGSGGLAPEIEHAVACQPHVSFR
jgi:hypothetical protein